MVKNAGLVNKLKPYWLKFTALLASKREAVIKKLFFVDAVTSEKADVLNDSRALFSKQVSKLICENHNKEGEESSFIFGLSGKWGIGKTRFLQQLSIDLEKDGEFTVITVSPWKYGSESLTFLRNFLKSLNIEANKISLKKYNKVAKFFIGLSKKDLPENLNRDVATIKFGGWYFATVVAIGLAWLIYQQFAPEDLVIKINTDLKYVKQLGIALFSLLVIPKLVGLVMLQEQSKAISTLDGFDEFLTKALNKFPYGSKLVVFVDDLDRVSPDIARTVLDTLRTFFDRPEVTFIVTGDHSVLERHIGSQIIHDGSVPEQTEEGKRYLKKIFNVYWQLPTQNDEEFQRFIENLVKEKMALKKSVFNRKPAQMQIFQTWLLKYFDKNFRNVKRFIDTILFNFDVINGQLETVDGELAEQIKDIKRHPLLAVRMMMIQEFAAPLFEDYIRTPDLVGKIEYEIAMKNGEALTNQVNKLNEQKRLSPSQEQFLRQFMYENPRFYDPEDGGNVVRDIGPFLYLAASSNSSDLRGPSAEDFVSKLDKGNSDQMLTDLENSGPPILKIISTSLLEKLSQLTESDPDTLSVQLVSLLKVLKRIDGKKLVQKLFKDLFIKVDMEKVFIHTRPLQQREELYFEFFSWLDSLSEETDFDHYYAKFELSNPAQMDVINTLIQRFDKFGLFSSKMIIKWMVTWFSVNKEGATQRLAEVIERIEPASYSDLSPLQYDLTSIAAARPDTDMGRQIWQILLKINMEAFNAAFDQKVAEHIGADSANVSNWLSENFDEVKELTGLAKTTEAIKAKIHDAANDNDRFRVLFLVHTNLFIKFKSLIWQAVIELGSEHVWQFSRYLQNDSVFSAMFPPESHSETIMTMIYDFANSRENETDEAQALALLERSDFWKLQKFNLKSRLVPKIKAKSKPNVQGVVKNIIDSWK